MVSAFAPAPRSDSHRSAGERLRPAGVAVVDVAVPVLRRRPLIGRDDDVAPRLVPRVHLLHAAPPVFLIFELPVVVGDADEIEARDIAAVGVVLLKRARAATAAGAMLLAGMHVDVAEVDVPVADRWGSAFPHTGLHCGLDVRFEDRAGEHVHIDLEPAV